MIIFFRSGNTGKDRTRLTDLQSARLFARQPQGFLCKKAVFFGGKMKRLLMGVLLVGSFFVSDSGALADSAVQTSSSKISEKVSAESTRDVLAADKKKTLTQDPFSVSSEEFDSSDSLNRISGHIDLGFSSPEQSFHSKDHYGAGPFDQERAQMSSKDSRKTY